MQNDQSELLELISTTVSSWAKGKEINISDPEEANKVMTSLLVSIVKVMVGSGRKDVQLDGAISGGSPGVSETYEFVIDIYKAKTEERILN